jgi:hypothetical protein
LPCQESVALALCWFRVEGCGLTMAGQVMEMYVGDKPVGPLIKRNIVDGYQELAERGAPAPCFTLQGFRV